MGLAGRAGAGQCRRMLWRIWRIIDRTVRGGESWYAAWQAIKDELKENWPTAASYIGSGLLAVWTFLEGLALPLAIVVGIVAFAALYTIRTQHAVRLHHSAQGISASPDDNRSPVTHDDLVKLVQGIVDSSEFARKFADLSEKSAVEQARTMILRDVMPELNKTINMADRLNLAFAQIRTATIDALVFGKSTDCNSHIVSTRSKYRANVGLTISNHFVRVLTRHSTMPERFLITQ
jgi:hypothetical protein